MITIILVFRPLANGQFEPVFVRQDNFDLNTRAGRVADFVVRTSNNNPKKAKALYYTLLAATAYGAYKAAPKVKAAAISVATKANNGRKAVVAKVKQLWNGKKEVVANAAASVAPKAKAVRAHAAKAPVKRRNVFA